MLSKEMEAMARLTDEQLASMEEESVFAALEVARRRVRALEKEIASYRNAPPPLT